MNGCYARQPSSHPIWADDALLHFPQTSSGNRELGEALTLDDFLPKAVRLRNDPEELRRGRLVLFAIVVANLATLLMAYMFAQLGVTTSAQAVLWTIPLHCVIYLLYLYGGSTSLAAHLFMLLVFCELVWDHPGSRGFVMIAIIALPVGAAALIGPRGALLWTAIGVLWAGWIGPAWVRPDYSFPLSLTVAGMTFVVGAAAVAIENTRALAMRHAERARVRVQRRDDVLREFLDSTFPAHVLTSKDGVSYASDAAAALLKYRVEDLEGLRLMEHVHPDDQPNAMEYFSGGELAGFRTELRLRQSDGEWVWVEAFGVPLGDSPILQSEWMFAARNIEQEQRRRERWQQAQRLEGVGLLAAGVAHDFNNLLTVIRGFSELLPAGEERDHVIAAADKATELTSGLMMFGRGLPHSDGVADVAKSLTSWNAMFQSLLGEACRLEVRAEPGLYATIGESELNQVLLNLVNNAKEAMGREGTLSIDTYFERIQGVTARSLQLDPGPYVCIQVTDTGHGMSADVRTRAFDPFFTTKDVGKGSGLGLASVYGIVQRQGGRVELDSEPDRGTRVTVWLPSVAKPRERDAPEAAPVETTTDVWRILLVEDDDMVREWAHRTLAQHGHEVRSCGDGDAALQMMRDSAPHVLITDIVMAGMRGTELALRARELQPGLGVLFMSGYADSDVAEWRSVGGEGSRFLAKPFGVDALLQAVAALARGTGH